ncbi:hypothetical protein [Bacillus suaedae]|uniref:Uncharacterized protein n=1 Tax=Halalkalibacter suaedae TaxID=2822140 RepID=A0A941ATG7_9BACI|nr:hypothetical protein [Bacillus suaedae]MBP3951719.1 hypothetical protein [Bacillus suaedae]
MASIVYTAILIVSFLFLLGKRNDEESFFSLRILGYFILGSFAFNFNQISLPLGFIVYLLFFRPKLNVDVKRLASVIGFLAFILVHWIFPFAVHAWEGREIYIEQELGSIYMTNFLDEYDQIIQGLKIESNDLKLEDFSVNYLKDGSITNLSLQLIDQNDNSFTHYQIGYEIDKSRYRVTTSQPDSWIQYNRLVEAKRFFENFDVLTIKDITNEKGEFSFYRISSTGERISNLVGDRTHYLISNEGVHLLEDEHPPVEGFYISTSAMMKIGEERDDKGNITQESFEGVETSDYLFDVNFSEE